VNVIPVPLLEPRDYVCGDVASQQDDVTSDAGSKECKTVFSVTQRSIELQEFQRRHGKAAVAELAARGLAADKYCFFIQSLNYHVITKNIYFYLQKEGSLESTLKKVSGEVATHKRPTREQIL